jgi:son of sevenless-like protein
VSSPRLRLGGSAAPSSLIGGTVTEDMSDDDSQFDSALQLPTSLSSVILDRNCLKSLPIELASLPKLSFLSMERNAVRSITSFPFARLPLLAALRLSHNQITAIPDSVSQLTALEVLELDYNNLLDVPAWLSGMRSLVRLSLSNNRLTETDNLKALLLSEGSGTIQYLNLRGNTGLARESGSSGVHRRSSAGLLAPATGADSSAQYSDSSASQSGQRRPRVYSQDHMLLFRQMVMMNLVRERIASSTLSPVPSGPAGRRKKLTRSLVVNPLFRYLDVDAYRRKHVDLKMISGFELVIKRGRPSLQRSKSAVDDSNLSSEDDRSLSTVKRLKRTFSAKLRSPSDRVASDYDSSGASGSDMSGSESEGGGSGIGGFDRGVISGTVASSARADRIRGGRSTASPEQLSPHPGSVSSRSVPGAIDEAGAAAAAAGGGDAMHSAALGDGAGAVAEAEDLSRMLCDDSFWRRVAKENDDALNVKSVSKYTASFEFMLSSSGSSTTASDQTFSQQFGGKVWEYFSEAKPTFFDDLMDVDGEVLFVRNQSGIGTRIKWATLPRMIELLTHPNGRDLDFESAFLFSFEEFSSAEELLDLLLLRDAALSNVSSIRRRIVFLLKRWVEIHPYHWKANGFRLVEQLRSWMRESTFSTEVAEAVSGLKDLLLERTTLWERSRRNRLLAFNYSRSSTYASTWQFRSCSSEEVSELFQVTVRAMPQPVAWFLSTSVQQLAGQLTLMDSVFYMTLEPRELFNTRWMKRDKAVLAKGTLRLIHQSNRVSQWVSSLVVSLEDVTQRQLVIERFILLAQRFLDMRNFHGIVAILSGLASLPVQRLKKTWARVRPGAAQMYQYLHDLMMDIPHNLRKFRALLELSSPPCVPYLGIFLRDLVHINETSRPTTPRSTRSIPTSLDSMQVLRVRRTSDLAKKKRSKSRKSAEDSPRRSGRAKDDGGSATDVALPPSEQQSVPRLNLALTRTSGEDEDVEPLSSGRDYCNLLGHSAVTVDPHRASTLRQRAWKLINFERLEMESLVVRKVLHFQQYTFSIRPAHKILPLIAPDLGLEEEELYRLSTLREAVAGGPIDFS